MKMDTAPQKYSDGMPFNGSELLEPVYGGRIVIVGIAGQD